MSETLWAVLITGVVSFIPQLVGFISNWREKKEQRKHEIILKNIELYEIPRKNALIGYMKLLGTMLKTTPVNAETEDEYFSAYNLASSYVDAEIRETMRIMNAMIVTNRYGADEAQKNMRKDKSLEYNKMRDFMFSTLKQSTILK